jgi:anti-sigma regulatory factor (Ser/Thr protein kinase)
MGSVLIDQWLAGAESTPMLDEASVVLLRQRVREEGTPLGLSDVGLGSIVNVASELAHNQLMHARGGRIAIRSIERQGVRGIELVAADRGSGIASPTDAVKGRPSPGTSQPSQPPGATKSLGVGFAAAMELADEIDVDVRIGEGTCIWARKFAGPVPRRRRVGIFGRPYPGEDESGDDGAFVRTEADLIVGVVDGLGHGGPAREASRIAVDTVRQNSHLELDRIVEGCHVGLHDTRGAVMAVARIDDTDQSLRGAAIGDVSLFVRGPGTHRNVLSRPFLLGARGAKPKVVVEPMPLGPRDVVILFTDGISSRADLQGDLDLLREHPVVIAHQIVERFSRDNDDALVLVVA